MKAIKEQVGGRPVSAVTPENNKIETTRREKMDVMSSLGVVGVSPQVTMNCIIEVRAVYEISDELAFAFSKRKWKGYFYCAPRLFLIEAIVSIAAPAPNNMVASSNIYGLLMIGDCTLQLTFAANNSSSA